MKALRGHTLDASIGGASLRAADSHIYVTNIAQEVRTQATFSENIGRDGRRRGRVRREVIRVTVSFRIWEFSSVTDREAILEKANAWARDGYLTVSTKPGRRMAVQCAARAAASDPRNYKEDYQIVFESSQAPYWEAAAATTFTLSGTSQTKTISVPGTHEAVFEATVTHSSGTLNTLSLQVGGTKMEFAALTVGSATTFYIDHDSEGRLRIYAGSSTTKYHCRSAASDDELIAGPGSVTAKLSADASCSVTLSCRGRYR
ncbi:MAG: hypothetical protein J5556_06965 [Deltaproteobacteria bacterium]|nr:hypothetical protein [Deltaproteobacteria bacterium]